MSRLDDLVARTSRELVLTCDTAGTVRTADARATRLLDLRPGDALRARVAPGCEAKLDDLLRRGVDGELAGFELPFVAHGEVVTVSLCTERDGDTLLVLGRVLPEELTRAMTQVNEMIAEVVDLNRTVTVQRNELSSRHAELLESHQGIVSLHRELQERSQLGLQDAEIKGRMVAHLSHELRTPLHSILGLTQLLLGGADGPLADEQQKQIRYIRSSADELLALVNDVLDLGRLEAGHAVKRLESFTLAEFLGAMRGVLRPLTPPNAAVTLIVEDGPDVTLETDRTKLAQIVRNLVANALAFTERGEVRVTTRVHDGRLILAVSDTGIGIPLRDHDTIFEEYSQLESPLQRGRKGTGLGLPLARRLATALGGTLVVDSTPEVGSTFTLDIPVRHDQAELMRDLLARSRDKTPGAATILLVEDDRHTLFIYERYLVMAGFHVLPARSVDEAAALMAQHRPSAIVLDIMLEGEASWSFLARLKNDPSTRDIPVLVVTVTNREDKARALGADEFWLKPVDQDRLLRKLQQIAQTSPLGRVLVIDDDETARYIIRRHLEGTPYTVFEAATGERGVEVAREQHPNVILLDFLLEGCTAFDVIDELKADPRTRGIPIIVVTSHVLDTVDQQRLLQEAEAVISKQNLSRELAIHRIRDALTKAGHRMEG